jgi:protoporphyrinogen oxidase
MKIQTQNELQGRRIGILGGGITGLTAAYYLLRSGAEVTIFESRPQLGGLSTYFNFGPFSWDQFYHCILTSDRPLLQLIDDLRLTNELRWTDTKVGFFADGSLHPMSSSLDFLKFPPLSLIQKARLGFGILYATRINDGMKLESELAAEWLTRIFGAANYRKMWGPLLKCKLGSCREEASAAFIWATIKRLYSTRDNKSKKEQLGYVRGGYRTVMNRLVAEIERMGGKIVLNAPVQRLQSDPHGGVEVRSEKSTELFDQLISTIPSRPLAQLAPELDPEYVNKLREVKYLGVVCFVLVLKRQLSPYYVTNLTDEGIPFTGIIEMSNLIAGEETAGRHLVYLPKYTAPGDALFEASEEEIWATFEPHLKRVVPDLQASDIEKRFLFRERFVQPVPVRHYSSLVPDMLTNIDGLLVANTTQIINSTLNNNEMVKIAQRAVALASQQRPAASLSADAVDDLARRQAAPIGA